MANEAIAVLDPSDKITPHGHVFSQPLNLVFSLNDVTDDRGATRFAESVRCERQEPTRPAAISARCHHSICLKVHTTLTRSGTGVPPRSPKLNGRVERANRTHTEEFYEVTPFSLPLAQLNRELLAWERIYNTVRPHQALGYLTPLEFLAQSSSQRKDLLCH